MICPPRYKIAVVIPKYGPVGGAERFAFEVTERLSRDSKYEFHVFANKWITGSRNIRFHKIPLITFPKFLTTPSFAYFANLKIKKQEIDLIHTHERIFRADIFTMHGIPHRTWVSEVRRKRVGLFDRATDYVEKKLVNVGRCKRFVAVSELAATKFFEQYHGVSERLNIISPGVDVTKFRPDGSVRAEWREKHNIPHDAFLLLFVGMNFELKGLTQLMQALHLVKKKSYNTDFRLLVVGKGNERKFRAYAKSFDLGQKVFFAGVYKKGIEKIYQAADLFVLLSEFDTFGITVLEAMAASVPVIISDCVGAKDIVSHGENGFIVPREDIGKISEYILFFMRNDKRSQFSMAALETASKKSWELVAKQYSNLYKEILTEL